MREVDLVVDTDVLIGALRGEDRTATWLASIEPQALGIPVLVLMEILLGARDKQEQRVVSEELARYAELVKKCPLPKPYCDPSPPHDTPAWQQRSWP